MIEASGGRPRPVGQPVFQQFEPGGTATPGLGSSERRGSGQQRSAVNIVQGLIQRQGLNPPSIDRYVEMWNGLAALTVTSPIAAEVRIPVTPEIQQTIVQVSRGLDFVLFDKITKEQQGSILRELAEQRKDEGVDRFIFSYEEGLLLRDAAGVVNVAYDPGTLEEVEKRTFKFDDLEQKAEQQGVTLPYWYKILNDE